MAFDNCANALINDQSCGPEVVWLVVNDRGESGIKYEMGKWR